MGCTSAKSSPDKTDPATGLSGNEKNAVRQSWKRMHAEWESKHGIAFFIRLFTNQPNVKTFFTSLATLPENEIANSPQLKSHVSAFGSSVTAMVDKLDDAGTLVALIHTLSESHFARSIDAHLHKVALQELLSFMIETLHLKKYEQEAWAKTAGVIAQVMEDHVKELKK